MAIPTGYSMTQRRRSKRHANVTAANAGREFVQAILGRRKLASVLDSI